MMKEFHFRINCFFKNEFTAFNSLANYVFPITKTVYIFLKIAGGFHYASEDYLYISSE